MKFDIIQDMIGQKQYEITDHLGNVLSTVSDQHLGRDINGDSVIDYYNAVIPAAYDYYPFGMLMPFRYTQDNSTHCATITTDKLYPVWVHHNIILNNGTTPIANSYGSGVATVLTGGTGINIYSPIITSGATISVPLQQKLAYNMDLNIQSISGSYSAQVLDSDSTVLGAITIAESGNFSLSYSAPSASPVTLVFKAQSAGSNISVLAAGYWVFTLQSQMVTMTICDQNDNYRFGFNGKLKDNEWAGLGNSLDYGARMEDTRIARFRSVDPLTKKFPELTTYQFASNAPIRAIDLDGLEAWINGQTNAMTIVGEGVRQYFDAGLNYLSGAVSASVNFTKNLFSSTNENNSTSTTTDIQTTNTTSISYGGWDIFKLSAYPQTATTNDIPAPKIDISNKTTTAVVITVKTQVGNSSYTNTSVVQSNGVVSNTAKIATTILTNGGIPVTFTASKTSSNDGSQNSELSVGTGPVSVYTQKTTKATEGNTTNTTVAGAKVKAQTPVIKGISVGAEVKVEVDSKLKK